MDEGLFERDWKNILDTIYRVNSVRNIEELQRTTMSCVRFLVPCCQGIFHVYKRESDALVLYNKPYVSGKEALYLDEFMSNYVQDYYFSSASVASQDSVFRDTDMMPDEIRTKTRWYREIYAKQGIHYALRGHLTRGGAIIGSIDLFRPKEDADFSEKDVRIMGALVRHVAQKLGGLMAEAVAPLLSGAATQQLAARFGLTAREGEVVGALIEGSSDDEVISRLCISCSTFKKHLHNVYRKMGVRNRSTLHAKVQATCAVEAP